VFLTNYYVGDHIKKNEMDGAHNMYGGTGKVHTRFQCVDLMERDHLEDLGLDGRILKWIFKKMDEYTWT
jgi:hypothetical protein